RFPDDERYGFFPAVAAGWIISDEDFADFDALSFLKLRASYGVIGNAGIDNFEYVVLLGSGADYDGSTGLYISQLANPNLSWEKNQQLDVGLEYGFIENRISGSLGYYNKKSSDLLLALPVSNTNGFTSLIQNTGKMENSGFEFNIVADILVDEFAWSV